MEVNLDLWNSSIIISDIITAKKQLFFFFMMNEIFLIRFVIKICTSWEFHKRCFPPQRSKTPYCFLEITSAKFQIQKYLTVKAPIFFWNSIELFADKESIKITQRPLNQILRSQVILKVNFWVDRIRKCVA